MNQKVPTPLYQTIYDLVRQIPVGKVMTYGQIAQMVGCTPRTVGFAMAALHGNGDVPWQRVINSQGKVSPRVGGEGNILQRDLLELEGLQFDQFGRINLECYRWQGQGVDTD